MSLYSIQAYYLFLTMIAKGLCSGDVTTLRVRLQETNNEKTIPGLTECDGF